MIPRELEEEDIRTALFCNHLYTIDGSVEFRSELQIACKEVMEKFIIFQLKNGANADYDQFLLKTIDTAVERICKYRKENIVNYSETFDNYKRKVFLWMSKWFELFPSQKYIPVMGPYKARIQISETVIILDISGIYKCESTKTVHIIAYLGDLKYTNPLYDIPTLCKILFGKRLKGFTNCKTTVHLFDTWYDSRYLIMHGMIHQKISSTDLDEKAKEYLLTNIKRLEQITMSLRLPACKWRECPKRKECMKDESR